MGNDTMPAPQSAPLNITDTPQTRLRKRHAFMQVSDTYLLFEFVRPRTPLLP
jgi:hypothetical protein